MNLVRRRGRKTPPHDDREPGTRGTVFLNRPDLVL